jgi:DNA-binding MarR family transcriptional regulator
MDTPLSLSQHLCFALYSASHAFTRVYKRHLEALGLTYPQYLVMTLLWEQDGQTVGALGAALHLESSTLTPLLKRLEALGLLTRARDPEDERQVRLRLTAEGAALRQKTRDMPGCLLAATGLSLEGALRMTGEVTRLRDTLLASE